MSHYSRKRRLYARQSMDAPNRIRHPRIRKPAAGDTSSIAGRLYKLGFPNYWTYLQSGHWQALRAAYISRFGPFCRECKRWPIEVHHRTYARLGSEPLSDLIGLCGDCHEAAHLLAKA